MPRIACDIEFDGTDFAGTQAQAELRTVQGEVGRALSALTGVPVLARPASRLDAGVSAASLPLDCDVPELPGGSPRIADRLRSLGLGLAGELPADITVRAVAAMPDGWHAQHAARAKTYTYRVVVRGTKPVLDRRCWWLRQIDHPERLQELADRLVGRQDLRTFACLRHDGSDEEDGARTITRATWQRDGGLLTFTITGGGFLYKQIRGFVGAMVHVAQGRRPVADFAALVSGDGTVRRLGNLAPPQGLRLERVAYDPEPEWVVL